MPRPSKHVSPDTLGGRIRAAREDLRLSLAEVASGHYSTSLISQIERNRVDPSRDSLRFLADRLKLSVDDLEVLAHQQRETEVEAHEYTSFDKLRSDATSLLANKQAHEALRILEPLHFPQVPALQRWRLAGLRGRCYFERRMFIQARGDLEYAMREEPTHENLPVEQKQERMLLHLRLAETYCELGELDGASEHFDSALRMMSSNTLSGYVAEAYLGKSLIALVQATTLEPIEVNTSEREGYLRIALDHAESAHTLYRSIGEVLCAATASCTIAEIQLERGDRETAHQVLLNVVGAWKANDQSSEALPGDAQGRSNEPASVASSAFYLLAEIEVGKGLYEDALTSAQRALQASKRSCLQRRAEVYVMLGRIHATMQNEEQAIQAFRDAFRELEGSQRMDVRLHTHILFGKYLISIGQIDGGQEELEKARLLAIRGVKRISSHCTWHSSLSI